jgi:amino acid transporter
MSFLDIFALVVIAILIAVVIWLVVLLGSMPGNIAKKRGHPQADAIQALGWIGIITLGAGWLVAIVWAYTKPSGESSSDPALEARVKALESRLEQLQGGEAES